jgi:lysophospholipase L1-like esterase
MKSVVMAMLAISLNIQIFSQFIKIEPPVRMLALGDSYSIGASVETAERWPHQLVAQLNGLGIEAEIPDYIAVTGWTTQDLLQGIRNSLDTEKTYNLVSILIGVNNQYQRFDIETYEPDLKEIIDRALDIVSGDTGRVFMLSIPDYAYTPFGKGNETITEGINGYNEINYRVAMAYNLTYVNITTISRRGLSEPELVAGDGLHPSGQQYALWVEAVLSYIKQAITHEADIARFQPFPSKEVMITPNPANDRIQVLYRNRRPQTVRIMNISGKMMAAEKPSGYSLHMNLRDYKPGIYWLESSFSDSRSVVPFIVIN